MSPYRTPLEPLTFDRPMSIRRPRTRVARAGEDRAAMLAINVKPLRKGEQR